MSQFLVRIHRLLVVALLSAALVLPARADEALLIAGEDLASMSLEDLMQLEVTSVSRQKQKVSTAPAAVYVITDDDIDRTGLHFIPELLRLSPGLHVARVDSNKWAVSARGFAHPFAEKLLVQMDGRTVYTPLFSGVYWDTVDYVMEDIDQIEVIRGPGATIWGANAVNGVISINTKPADDTQGWLLHGVGGTEDRIGSVRYGGQLDDQTFYRIYTKYRGIHDSETRSGDTAHDAWETIQGGFRLDRYTTRDDVLTLQGDMYYGDSDQTLSVPVFSPPFETIIEDDIETRTANILGRWVHTAPDGSELALQTYYDRFERNDDQLDYLQNTFDVDFHHRFALAPRHEVIWGLGYRYLWDDIKSTEFVRVDPQTRYDYRFSAFIQDDITLAPDRLHLIPGTKLEYNSYTGLEIQPSVRGVWTPDDRQTVWGAVSRAVRTPSRWEEDATVIFERMADPMGGPLPISAETIGNDELDSEELIAYELGYRVQPRQGVTLDVVGFYHDYDKLRSIGQGTPFPNLAAMPPHVVVPLLVENDLSGKAYGAEFSSTWTVTDNWRLIGSYTYTRVSVHTDSPAVDILGEADIYEDGTPRNQFQIRSYYNMTRNLALNSMLFYVDDLDIGASEIPAYARLDVNVQWRPRPNVELTAGVQNALDPSHREFIDLLNFVSTEMERSIYAQLTFTD